MSTPKGFRPASYKPPKITSPKFPKVASYKPPRMPAMPKPPKATVLPRAKAVKLPRSSANLPRMTSRAPAPTMLPRATRMPTYRAPKPVAYRPEPYPRHHGSLLGLVAKVFIGYRLFRWLRPKPRFPSGPMPMGNLVYAIEGPMGHVKIGTTMNLPARVKELQTGSPVPLRVLAACPGDIRLESALHAKYARYRLSGEWFALPQDELQALLAQMRG